MGAWGFTVAYGIAVLGFFSCGISSSSSVCGFSSSWLTVLDEIRLFTVLRYRLERFSYDLEMKRTNKTETTN